MLHDAHGLSDDLHDSYGVRNELEEGIKSIILLTIKPYGTKL